MAVITYEPVEPGVIAHTTMRKLLRDGGHQAYYIAPISGYVLHDKARDWTDTDPISMEETYKLGFTRGTAGCAASYDFEANPREFYAVPEDSVPADQIFGNAYSIK